MVSAAHRLRITGVDETSQDYDTDTNELYVRTVFWVAAPCSLVDVFRRFRGDAASIIRAMGKPHVRLTHRTDDGGSFTSETSVNYQTTRRSNPEDSHLHTRRCENLKSHLLVNILHSA
jgi:hypothetical protein